MPFLDLKNNAWMIKFSHKPENYQLLPKLINNNKIFCKWSTRWFSSVGIYTRPILNKQPQILFSAWKTPSAWKLCYSPIKSYVSDAKEKNEEKNFGTSISEALFLMRSIKSYIKKGLVLLVSQALFVPLHWLVKSYSRSISEREMSLQYIELLPERLNMAIEHLQSLKEKHSV